MSILVPWALQGLWGGVREIPRLWGGKELKPTRLYFALFLLYFKPVLNGRPVVGYPWFVPVGSQRRLWISLQFMAPQIFG